RGLSVRRGVAILTPSRASSGTDRSRIRLAPCSDRVRTDMLATSFPVNRFRCVGLRSHGCCKEAETDRNHHEECRQNGPGEFLEVLAVHLRLGEVFQVYGQDARTKSHDISFPGANVRLP